MACENCVQSVSQIFGLHRFRVAIVIDSTLVLKSALLVKRENVWGADCAVFLRDFLCVVSQVGKVEVAFLSSLDHVWIAVFRIAGVVVAVYRHKGNSFRRIILLDLKHPVFVRLHVGAVIAAENDYQSFLVREAFQAVSLTVYSFQLKIDRGCA